MKSIVESKTFWLNAISALVMVLGSPELLGIVPPGSAGYFAAAVAVLNIILRVYFTNTQVRH